MAGKGGRLSEASERKVMLAVNLGELSFLEVDGQRVWSQKMLGFGQNV